MSAASWARARLDGFRNLLTGIGDPSRDKTFGGSASGPQIDVNVLTSLQAEARWRGTPLGGAVVEKLPSEMPRAWIDLSIQPDEEDDGDTGAMEGVEQAEELLRQLRDLGARGAVEQALCYVRAYGGAAILPVIEGPANANANADAGYHDAGRTDGFHADGLGFVANTDPRNLTAPLDETMIGQVTGLNVFAGGFDGEAVAWRYYSDPLSPRYGEPEIYQIRNIGVPMVPLPVPGEQPPKMPERQPVPTVIAWVHESRLLVFPGRTTSARQRAANRGWADSVFTRVDKVLRDYGMTWDGLAILLSEWAQGVLSVEGLADMMSAPDDPDGKSGARAITARALALNMAQSIARVRIIDSKEKFTRETLSFSGIPEMMREFALQVAAAADEPVSLLFGQVEGGSLGNAGTSDRQNFQDEIRARQERDVRRPLERLLRMLFLAATSPTGGVVPKKWALDFAPLVQPTAKERADERNVIAQTDAAYIDRGVVSAAEVAASRFGGARYSPETVIDVEARRKMAALQPAPDGETTQPDAPTAPNAGTTGPAKSAEEALNGAQVQALQAIVESVARGELPRESGVEMILVAFPLDRTAAERVMGPVGRSFTPEPPAKRETPATPEPDPA